ncbi:Phosphatidylinositol 4-phosphate 5-kinase-like protein 1, partial [Eschrichtius robustus]|nr:Phosphatidylinositol 4-phosphate 5-kinase-like protein 1 [Eschrichtius robustus]
MAEESVEAQQSARRHISLYQTLDDPFSYFMLSLALMLLCHERVLAPSPEAGHRAATSSSGRRGLLWRLRDKQSRLGLFEIGPGHELHQLTCMMQAGLWAATQVSMDHPPTGFELGTLAGPAFARLRRSLGLAEEDYQAALGPGGPYLQFLSTSKSKASFFLSHDQRFFLKTLRRREVRALLAHLPRYVQHLQRHPHSLLARYDIKGCEVSRWVEPAPEGSPFVLVLKDLNFQGKTINLGPQRSWLLRQMELDTAFLRELNVLDYSLLMAFQRLHEDERGPGSSLIFRTARWCSDYSRHSASKPKFAYDGCFSMLPAADREQPARPNLPSRLAPGRVPGSHPFPA